MWLRTDVGLRAAFGCVDLALDGPIRPCPACRPWRAEIVRDVETGDLVVREWHAVGCPDFIQLLLEQASRRYR